MTKKNKTSQTTEPAIAVDTLLAAGWFDINTTPPPNDVQVLVRLERKMLGGWYSVATFGRIPLIGSLFAWDAPKPTHWMNIPACS
jgi:hypothetical protein